MPAVPDLHPGEDRPAGASSRTCASDGRRARRAGARPVRRLRRASSFEEHVDFYRHDGQLDEPDDPRRLAAGDDVSLAEKEGLKGKVQMIYIDPPYGIKFGSNWQVSTRKRDVKDGKAEDATRQPEQVRAFRDTWELGIHSYLTYLRDRLVVARELLTETGLASSSRSATRTCTSSDACWTRCSARENFVLP